MRQWIGPILVVLGIIFTVDLYVHATPDQKRAFVGAVERTNTYAAAETVLPDEWFRDWTDSWRETLAPTVAEDGGDRD